MSSNQRSKSIAATRPPTSLRLMCMQNSGIVQGVNHVWVCNGPNGLAVFCHLFYLCSILFANVNTFPASFLWFNMITFHKEVQFSCFPASWGQIACFVASGQSLRMIDGILARIKSTICWLSEVVWYSSCAGASWVYSAAVLTQNRMPRLWQWTCW